MADIITRTVRNLLTEALNSVKTSIEANMRTNRRNASFDSVNSLKVVIKDDTEGSLVGKQSFWVIERGRKGGRVPKGFYYIIYQWVKDKGINVTPIPYKPNWHGPRPLTPEERGRRNFAYLVSKKIEAKGTRLHISGGFQDIYTSASDRAAISLSDKLALYASTIIDKSMAKI